jgi:hypothetical protein
MNNQCRAKTIGEYFRDRWFETQIKSNGEDRTLINAEMPFMLWINSQGLLDSPIDDLPALAAKYEKEWADRFLGGGDA